MNAWRAEDEALLQRLEDETLAERLFAVIVGQRGDPSVRLHPRAGGLVGEVRLLPGGADAVAAALEGDIARLGRFIDSVALRTAPPALLHHLALFHGKAATALEKKAPQPAATAWVWALASWLALVEERTYLASLGEAVLGKSGKSGGISPDRDLIADLGQRADASARDLAPSGTAALLALARAPEAARIAGVIEARQLKIDANRRKNSAIESALNAIADAIDEANVRGEMATAGRNLVVRAVAVWTWSGWDEQVEHFVVTQLDRIGWELYRLRNWTELRYLLDPFKPMMETLAARVEKDPSQLAYAAGCAQMFVFMAETDLNPVAKLAIAERALKICPTHRNARVVLASMLCDRATDSLREMTIVKRAAEIERVEGMIARAEALYPQTRELPEVKKKLEHVKTQVRLTW